MSLSYTIARPWPFFLCEGRLITDYFIKRAFVTIDVGGSQPVDFQYELVSFKDEEPFLDKKLIKINGKFKFVRVSTPSFQIKGYLWVNDDFVKWSNKSFKNIGLLNDDYHETNNFMEIHIPSDRVNELVCYKYKRNSNQKQYLWVLGEEVIAIVEPTTKFSFDYDLS